MFRLIKLIIWLFVISGIVFYINYNNFKDEKIVKDKIITVQKWDNLVSALKRELSFSEFYLKVYLKLNPDKKIWVMEWEYRLSSWDSVEWIIKTLSYWAKSREEKLTLLEWWNIYDIDEYLVSRWLANAGEFIAEAKNIPHYISDFSFLQYALSLEWYLYPDTYFINPTTFKIQDFNSILLENFRKKSYDNLLSTLTPKEFTEVMILASIVEKEERNKNEKPTVAGILKKRYMEKWFIGADITACYAFKLTSNQCKMNLSKYIWEKNEYNTRSMVWLPKTPICNPSFESVNAVINSFPSPYYYYLHDSTTGKVYYAKTNEEHVRNKSLYIK